MAARTDPGPGPGPADPCPRWCRGRHAATDHPEDRHHRSRAHPVAVVTGHPPLEPDESAEAVSVTVGLLRRADSTLSWLEVVSEEGPAVRLVLTTESARRLLSAVGALLGPPD
jgi:hypothetical protein